MTAKEMTAEELADAFDESALDYVRWREVVKATGNTPANLLRLTDAQTRYIGVLEESYLRVSDAYCGKGA